MPRYRMKEDYPSQYLALSLEMQPIRMAYRKKLQQFEEQRRRTRYYEKQQEAYEKQQKTEAQARQMRVLPKLRKLEEKRQLFRYYEKTAPPEWKESVEFYTELGYPLYAGKYAPFTVPEGYKVSGITKTSKGLEVAFVSTAPKGIAQTIYDIQLPQQAEYERVQSQLAKAGLPAKPPAQKLLGAFLAPFESAFYGIGSLVGGVVKTVQTGKPQLTYGWEWVGLETPRIPATLSGGLVTSGVQSIISGKPVASEEMKKFKALTHEEKMAGLLGEITLAWLTGKAVTKVTHVIAKPIQTKAESWLTKRYLGKVPSGGFIKETTPFESKYGFIKPSGAIATEIPIKSWAGWSERIVMTLTGAKPYTPSGIVSFPAVGTVSMKGLKAQQLAWKLSLTPRTSLVTVTKVGAKRSVFTFTRGVGYTPMAVTLAKAMSVKDMGGRQALLVIQKPTRGKLPYLPSLIFKESTTRLPQLLGIGLTLGLKGLPKPFITEKLKRKEKLKPLLLPKLVSEVTPITQLTPFISPISRVKERLIPDLTAIQTQTIKQITIQETTIEQIPIQKTMLKQVTAQIPSIPTPTLTIQTFHPPKIPPFRLPRRRVVSRRERGLFGKWFRRTHKIKTPAEMARTFFGEPKPRRKKRSKTKRAKKKPRRVRKGVKKKRMPKRRIKGR